MSRKQLPLVLAWGISIHKSQGRPFDIPILPADNEFAGMTLDGVEVDLTHVSYEPWGKRFH